MDITGGTASVDDTVEVQVVRTGRLDYLPSWDLQRRLARARRQGLVPDLLLLVEHPPTYTVGRSGSRDNLLIDEATLAAVGASCVEIDRGGDITFHGPGQIVAYVILDLGQAQRSVRRHVERLEQTVIRTLASYGVEAGIDPRHPGVWVGLEKVAALGIAVSRGVTYHGFALNVDPELRYFGYMIPCGIRGRGATSLTQLLGQPVPVEEVSQRLIASFGEVFARTPRFDLTLAELERAAQLIEPPDASATAEPATLPGAG